MTTSEVSGYDYHRGITGWSLAQLRSFIIFFLPKFDRSVPIYDQSLSFSIISPLVKDTLTPGKENKQRLQTFSFYTLRFVCCNIHHQKWRLKLLHKILKN